MTAAQIAAKCGFEIAAGSGEREINGIYCGDLLSVVMGRAPADCVWVTVMGNINAIAVAVLADAGCILLSEGMQPDAAALARAEQENITVLTTPLPTFEAAHAVYQALSKQ